MVSSSETIKREVLGKNNFQLNLSITPCEEKNYTRKYGLPGKKKKYSYMVKEGNRLQISVLVSLKQKL